jgi:tRNA pseudouridine13 synthase
MLDGSHSIFGPVASSPEIATRLAGGDIHPTAPMWGRGELRSQGEVRMLELDALAPYADLRDGLELAGLEQERRSLRLPVRDCRWRWLDAALEVEFRLSAGSYATAVLREVARWTDASAVPAMQE